jgi:esterase/lipase superfamily enzyme
MMPAPAAISNSDLDPFADTPEEERNSNIMVGYATNRKPLGAKEARFYPRDFDQDLRMGNVIVRIGDGTMTWDEIRELSREGARKDQVLLSLLNVEELGTLEAEDSLDTLNPETAEMMADLNRYIEKSPLKDITIYVHGANNNFYRTAAQAAQYRHFTGRQAVVILYSWPSAESIVRYGTDIRNIRKTVPTFVRFIRLLAKHSVARKINILAYSAGSTLTTEGLAMLAADTSNPDRQSYKDSLRIGSVYFAAPDADFDDWVEQYRSYQDIVDRVTVTVNENDAVLGIAQEEHRGKIDRDFDDDESGTTKSRLGRPDIDDISVADRDWLIEQTNTANFDVLDIDPFSIPGLGKGDHDFWYNSPWVSTDALVGINLGVSPAERGLAEKIGPKGARIWYFPDDYEKRVAEAIKKLNEKYKRLRTQ